MRIALSALALVSCQALALEPPESAWVTWEPQGPIMATSYYTTETPVVTDGTDSSNDYEIGNLFHSAVDGVITAVRIWQATSEAGTNTWHIWNASTQAELATATLTGINYGDWTENALGTPLAITAGTDYIVSCNINDYYVATFSGLTTPITNGNLTTDGGRIYPTIGQFPANSNLHSYFRDVVFVENSQLEAAGSITGGAVVSVAKAASALTGDASTLGGYTVSPSVAAAAMDASGGLAGDYVVSQSIAAAAVEAWGSTEGTGQTTSSISIPASALIANGLASGTGIVSVGKAADPLQSAALLVGGYMVGASPSAAPLAGSAGTSGSSVIGVTIAASFLGADGSISGTLVIGGDVNLVATPLLADSAIAGGHVVSVSHSAAPIQSAALMVGAGSVSVVADAGAIEAAGQIDASFSVSVIQAASALLANGLVDGTGYGIGPGALPGVKRPVMVSISPRYVARKLRS